MTCSNTVFQKKTALVIGATGGVGGAVARTLLARGWTVKALNRNPDRLQGSALLSAVWIKGDSMSPADVLAAAQGVDLIVHAANPPGYRDWDKLVLPMLDSTIAAAKATGARILFPGTIYNYGPDLYDEAGVIFETSPQTPVTRKGKIRAEMERRLKASGVKTLIVRAGDFFGPNVTGNSWFSQMIKPGKPVRSVVYPGTRGIGHAWAYLPDLAETMVQLADRGDELETFATFNFAGHWFDRGEAMAQAILRVADQPANKITRFPWPLIVGLSPFAPLFREVLEMRYLWKRPLRLDNSRLIAFLGQEPHTSIDCAVAVCLESLGCLKADWPVTIGSPIAAEAYV